VVVAALQDAGFHPEIECDPRGWMHFYGWPLASNAPTLIWIPSVEADEASGFLQAPSEPSWDVSTHSGGFAAVVSRWRRWLYALWLAESALGLLLSSAFWLAFLVYLVLRSRFGR
jgi:hypothetical protein